MSTLPAIKKATKASDCTIRMFMACLFEDDFSQVDEEKWSDIYTEYIDLSGIGETRQKDILVAIHNIQVRMYVIPEMIKFLVGYFNQYGEPYFEALKFFKQYGHKITWNAEQPDEFVKQLERMDLREKRFIPELNKLQKELTDLQTNGMQADDNGRKDFVKLLNAIGMHRGGNDVDRDKIDVYSYALMVREYLEAGRKQAPE